MRFIVWNMSVGSPGALSSRVNHERAWRWLADQEFDLVLLQECREPPSWLARDCRAIEWSTKPRGGRPGHWGSAVISRTVVCERYDPVSDRFPWLAAFPGSSLIVRTDTEPEWVASVHLGTRPLTNEQLEQMSTEGVEVTARTGSIWQQNVVPHELHELFGDSTFLWGGDLNIDRRMDAIASFAGGNGRLFDIYSEAGAVRLRPVLHGEPSQTYFKPGLRVPWELDHIFADRVTAERMTEYEVDPSPANSSDALSDHAAIRTVLGPKMVKIPSQAERRAAMDEFFATTSYVDPVTGEAYNPDELPDDPTPDGPGNDEVASRSSATGPRRAGEPRLLGAREAAEVLGVSQTNLRVVRGLPEPYDKIRATTLWRADDIEALARKRRRADR